MLDYARPMDECIPWSTLCYPRRRVGQLIRMIQHLINLFSFDVEFPVECDEEYWETDNPKAAFKQPPGIPSQMSYMIAMIRLTEILAFTLRTLYSTKKSKMLTGMIGSDWEVRIVAEIDSSMNKWKDSLPHFCKYNQVNRVMRRLTGVQYAGIPRPLMFYSFINP